MRHGSHGYQLFHSHLDRAGIVLSRFFFFLSFFIEIPPSNNNNRDGIIIVMSTLSPIPLPRHS